MADLKVDFAGIHLINRVDPEVLNQATQLCVYAREIGVEPVLLTKMTDEDAIARIMGETGADWLQLHRAWSPTNLARLRARLNDRHTNLRLIELVSPEDIGNLTRIREILEICEFIIIDHAQGGTGRLVSPTQIATFFDQVPSQRVFIAGGLTPSNVSGYVQKYQPAAVDVQSGVMGINEVQDYALMQAFVATVRGAEMIHPSRTAANL